jgi:hypothetical protein
MRQFLHQTYGAFIAHHTKYIPMAGSMTSGAGCNAADPAAVGGPMRQYGKRGKRWDDRTVLLREQMAALGKCIEG